MDLTLTFKYTEKETPPRCRKPRNVTHDDGQLTVTIPEVTGAEAPIAGILYERAYDARGNRVPAPPLAYRFFQGKLWSPEPLGFHDRKEGPYPPITLPLDYRLGVDDYSRLPGHDYQSRAAREQAIREWAAQLLLVDGQTHRPAPLPYYEVRVDSYGGQRTVWYRLDHSDDPVRQTTNAIPVTQRDVLVVRYRDLRGRLVPTDEDGVSPDAPDADRVEVVIPEAFAFQVYERRDFEVTMQVVVTVSASTLDCDLSDEAAVQEVLVKEAQQLLHLGSHTRSTLLRVERCNVV